MAFFGGGRAQRKTEIERLLEVGPRQVPDPLHPESQPPAPTPTRGNRLPPALHAILWMIAVAVLPRISEWASIGAMFLLLAVQIGRYGPNRKRGTRDTLRRFLRGLALMWLVVAVVAAVLIGLDTYQRGENQIALLVILVILGLLWAAVRATSRGTSAADG
jgi:peptidoglycan/LPS O-acetylase OafA/YrhL